MAKYQAADRLSHEIFDLDRRFGDVLVRLGMIKAYEPKKRQLMANTIWGVSEFKCDGTPYLLANCQTCKPNGLSNAQWVYQGHTPEVAVFHHCGIDEKVPADICADYLAAIERRSPEKMAERKRRSVHKPAF